MSTTKLTESQFWQNAAIDGEELLTQTSDESKRESLKLAIKWCKKRFEWCQQESVESVSESKVA